MVVTNELKTRDLELARIASQKDELASKYCLIIEKLQKRDELI